MEKVLGISQLKHFWPNVPKLFWTNLPDPWWHCKAKPFEEEQESQELRDVDE